MFWCLGFHSTWAEGCCCQLEPVHVGIQSAVSCSESQYDDLLLSGKVAVGIFVGCATECSFDESGFFFKVY